MIVATLIAAGSTQCMVIKGLKAALRGAGTAIGVGLPTIPFITFFGYPLYKNYKVPIKTFTVTRVPSHEEKIIKVVSDKKATIRISTNPLNIRISSTPSTSCTLLDKAIEIKEKKSDYDLNVDEALESNTLNALKVQDFTPNSAFLKSPVAMIMIPCTTTGVIVTSLKKLMPLNRNSSLIRHCGRFGSKVIGGSLLAITNIFADFYAWRYMAHKQVYAADQNISLENRESFIEQLKKREEREEEAKANIAASIAQRIKEMEIESLEKGIIPNPKKL